MRLAGCAVSECQLLYLHIKYKLHAGVVLYNEGPPGTDVASMSLLRILWISMSQLETTTKPTLVTRASWRRHQMVWRMQQQVTAVVCLHQSVGLANQRGGGGECGAFLWRLNPRQFPAMFALSLERGCVNNSDVSCRECWPWCWWSSCWRLPFTDWLTSWKRVSQLTSMFR